MNVKELYILLEVLPVPKVPCTVGCWFRYLLDLLHYLLRVCAVIIGLLLVLVLVPHAFDKQR